MNFTDLQFSKGRNIRISLCPTAVVGQTVAAGLNSTKAPASKAAKHSIINHAMQCLLADRSVSAICVPDVSIYAETSNSHGVMGVFYDGVKIYTTIGGGKTKAFKTDDEAIGIYTTILLYALNSAHNFSETQSAFAAVREEYEKNGIVSEGAMALACSCFYYDTKDVFPTELLEADLTTDIIKMINQGIRTHTFSYADKACPVGKVFSHIDTDGATLKQEETNFVDSVFMDDCKSGNYEIGMNWTKEQQEQIVSPEMLDGYVSNKTFEKLTKVAHYELSQVVTRLDMGKDGRDAIGTNYLNAILVGKPGTGKTTAAEALSAALGFPLYTIPVTKNTEEDTFSGMTKAQNGGFNFVSTPFLDAFENGGIVVIEEFNLADPGVLQGAIGQAIEPPFLVLKDGYRPVYRNPMCVFLFTMNTGTQGSREPNEALASRAPFVLVMEDPEPEVFVEILERKSGDTENSKKVYNAYTKILEYLKEEAAGSEDLPMSITTRHCIKALTLMKAGYSIKDAINDTIIGALAVKDLEIARSVNENVLQIMPL